MIKKKFTWIDLVIALIILISITGVVYKFTRAKLVPITAKEKLLVSFYVENAPDSSIAAIREGDPVRETVQNADFGKVVKIETGDSIFWECGEDGKYISTSRAGYSSLTITMEAYGVINRNGVTIDKSVYYVGQTISLYAGKSEINNGRISKIVKAQ